MDGCIKVIVVQWLIKEITKFLLSSVLFLILSRFKIKKSLSDSWYNRKIGKCTGLISFVQNTIKQIEDSGLHCILEKYLLWPFVYISGGGK
jgi:hypothetical protein